MPLPAPLARFLPDDPGYAPFGWAPLRGLNMVPALLVAALGASLALQRMLRGLLHPGDTLWNSAWRSAMTVVQFELLFMPLLVLLFMALNRWADGARTGSPLAGIAAAVAAGAGVFAVLWPPSFCVTGRVDWGDAQCQVVVRSPVTLSHFVMALLWGGLIATILWFDRRGRALARAVADTRRRRIEIERIETETRLRALQAQIEPHFLFNTLAHLRRFQASDPEQGQRMLSSLIDYMRAALPQMREPESTLRRELALTRAYADVQQIRMGDRLRVEIDVPEALLDASMPPMLVLTLAENAVKHGLGPKREGGTLRIEARRVDGQLEVAVLDDGVGLRLGSGHGRGLANTRSRLATQFGAAAALAIGSNEGGPGVRAALWLPLRRVASITSFA
jgi:two-component sensor histidine kinase